jgi:hypothetical protein
MKFIKIWLGSLLALMCITGVQAADMAKANVMRVYTDTVTPAEQTAYEAGVKSYNQCLSQHSFKVRWIALNHETGNTYSYSYVSDPVTWAGFDSMRATGKACDAVWQSAANPHLQSETSSFLVAMPEMSHMPKGSMDLGTGLIGVSYTTLKNGHDAHMAYVDAVKKITAAADKSNWPGHYMVSSVEGGDVGAPDFIIAWPAKDWADYGMDINPTFWKMVENVYGKKEAAALRKTLNDAVKESSSHIDSYNADLTYTPEGK